MTSESLPPYFHVSIIPQISYTPDDVLFSCFFFDGAEVEPRGAQAELFVFQTAPHRTTTVRRAATSELVPVYETDVNAKTGLR